MTQINPSERDKQAIIFLAQGFDEEFVVRFFCEQRRTGHNVLLVGVQAGDIFGRCGLSLSINATVSEFTRIANPPIEAFCIPGDTRCATAILSDPRVMRLLGGNRPIHATPAAQTILQAMNIDYHDS